MTLTLGNDLTGAVAREVGEASRKSSGLGESLTTGNNKFVEVVDGFLGSSLRDSEIVLGAIAKNTAYSINMLTITDEYLKTVATSLQEGLKTIGSAGHLSADKLAVLQKNLNDKRSQVDLLIKTADFDGKALLGGGAKAVEVQVGLSIADKLTLKVNDIGSGKLFRSSVAAALNEYLAADAARSQHYAGTGNAQAFADAKATNTNLIHASLTTGAIMTGTQLGMALNHAIQNNSSMADFLEKALPTSAAALGVGVTFANATAGQLGVAFSVQADATIALSLVGKAVANAGNAQGTADAVRDIITNDANIPQAVKDAATAAAAVGGATVASVTAVALSAAGANRSELLGILGDNAATNISDAGDEANRVLAQDVFTNALNSIRAEQSSVSNQKQNVVGAADALRATTNVTQKSADSYLKTDYVMTAQQYSETIRTMVASITALQAANKIPEAAQRLIDALAR